MDLTWHLRLPILYDKTQEEAGVGVGGTGGEPEGDRVLLSVVKRKEQELVWVKVHPVLSETTVEGKERLTVRHQDN